MPVSITHADGTAEVKVNQKRAPVGEVFATIGTYRFSADKPAVVVISNAGTDGYVVADAVQLLPAK